MSDTPRTNAAAKWNHEFHNELVHADFARQLERERNKLEDELDNCRDRLGEFLDNQNRRDSMSI